MSIEATLIHASLSTFSENVQAIQIVIVHEFWACPFIIQSSNQ